jgi:4-amino-4-deoxy-L-arabinose transferase-like glycosyltransferase
MYMNIKNKKTVILLLIIFLAAFLRLFRLDIVPAALNWDEIDAGYNAYTIANWGRDEWDEFLPLVFTSFRDDKHPVHIYSLVPFVKLFGLSDFVTRLPSALAGILSVLIIYYLSKYLFKDYMTSFLAALFLAISPYHLQFSRGLWESNFALTFFLLGLLVFYRSLNGYPKLLSISFLSFGISLFAYHSSKVIVIPLVFLLVILYIKDLKKLSWNFYCALIILLIFISILILNPRLTGLARVKQTQFSQADIEKTQTFQKTKNAYLGLAEITLNGVFTHFNLQYLFIKGDQTPRNSVKVFGEFYKTDALFIVIGLIGLLFLRSKVSLFLLVWLLISPVPASIVGGAPNANRAIFMIGSWILISAFGASNVIKMFKGKFRTVILGTVLLITVLQAFSFISYYFTVYPKKDPHDWVYGMKQIVEYIKDNDDNYDQIYITDVRSQPYIFFLYYLKYPLPDFTRTVSYNNQESKSYNTVSFFGKYYFAGWDTVESMPQKKVLYVLSPTQYDGLRHKMEFDVKKVVSFPDKSTAFFMVSAK